MKGYYNDSSKSNDTIKDGWLLTGDLAYCDEDGYFYITRRKKNIIKYNGYRISPEEIDEILLSDARILEAVEYGSEDEFCGQLIHANIVFSSGETMSRQEINELCKQHLPLYKIPGEIHILQEISKTVNGKIKRPGKS